MTKWEYEKIDLNSLPRGQSDLGTLNAAGAEGWELVAINTCNIAIMKREIAPVKATRATAAARTKTSGT